MTTREQILQAAYARGFEKGAQAAIRTTPDHTDARYMLPTPQRLYNAINQAEMTGEKDHWIRTRHQPKGGSTAYGPVQITSSLASGYLKNKPELFTPEQRGYLERLVYQGGLFNQHGGNAGKPGHDAKFDYGGKGVLHTPAEQARYKSVAETMLMDHMAGKTNAMDAVKQWRFGPDNKGKTDTRYMNQVSNSLKR